MSDCDPKEGSEKDEEFSPDSLSSDGKDDVPLNGHEPEHTSDDVNELSYMSLNETAAVELSLDLLGENNRLMQECRSHDADQKRTIDKLLCEHGQLEARVAEALQAQETLQTEIAEERKSKDMIMKELKTENGRMRRNFEDAQAEIEKLRKLLKMMNNKSPTKDPACELREHSVNAPDIIDGAPSVDQLYEALNQANIKEKQLRKEFEEVVESSGNTVERLTTELLSLQNDLHILNDSHDQLQEQVHDNETLIDSLNKLIDKGRDEYGVLQVQLQDSENVRCLTEAELRRCELSKCDLQNQVDQLRHTRDKRQAVDGDNKLLQDRVDTLSHKLKKTEIELHDTQITVANLQKELDDSRKTVNFLRSEGNTPIALQDTIESLKNQIDSGFARENELRTLNDQMNARIAAVADVQKAFEALKMSNESAKQRLVAKDKAITDKDTKIRDLERIMDEHIQEKKQLNSQSQKLEESVHAAKVDLEAVSMQFDDFRTNANAQYNETCRQHEQVQSRLLSQLHKLKQYPGKEETDRTSSSTQTDDVQLCSHKHQIDEIRNIILNDSQACGQVLRNIVDLFGNYYGQQGTPEALLSEIKVQLSNCAENAVENCKNCLQLKEKVVSLQTEAVESGNLANEIETLKTAHVNEIWDLNNKIEQLTKLVEQYKAQIAGLNEVGLKYKADSERLNETLQRCKTEMNSFQGRNQEEMRVLREKLKQNEDEIWNVRTDLKDKCNELETLTEQFVSHVQNSEVLHAESLNTVQKLSEALEEEKVSSDRLRQETVQLHSAKEQLRRKLNDERTANEVHMATVDMVGKDLSADNKRLRMDVQDSSRKVHQIENKRRHLVAQKKAVVHELWLVRSREAIALRMLGVPKARLNPLAKFRSTVIVVLAAIKFMKSINQYSDQQLFPSKTAPTSDLSFL